MAETPYYQWRPHPWHGLEAGARPPELVNAYIEITPFDLVKYEVDKFTGYLRVDRPQRTSSSPPTLYGFIPRTYCGKWVGEHSPNASTGDGDPLDICVISERMITKSEVIVPAKVVGAIRTLDKGEADDKIIAVLEADNFWGQLQDVTELPKALVERLRHYFSTYKLTPGQQAQVVIEETLNAQAARQVVNAAIRDYQEFFGNIKLSVGE
jgi:inorganic pyrophosphatase